MHDVKKWDCSGGTKGKSGYDICAGAEKERYHKFIAPNGYSVPARFGFLNETAAFVLGVDHVGRVGNGASSMFVHGATPNGVPSLSGGGAAKGLANARYGESAMPMQSGARSPGGPLPPTAVDAFIEGASLIPEREARAAVIAGYSSDISEVNLYYQSMFDLRKTIDVDALTKVATSTARALYALATVEDIDNSSAIAASIESPGAQALKADADLVSALVNCSTVSWDCPVAVDYLGGLIESYKKIILSACIQTNACLCWAVIPVRKF